MHEAQLSVSRPKAQHETSPTGTTATRGSQEVPELVLGASARLDVEWEPWAEIDLADFTPLEVNHLIGVSSDLKEKQNNSARFLNMKQPVIRPVSLSQRFADLQIRAPRFPRPTRSTASRVRLPAGCGPPGPGGVTLIASATQGRKLLKTRIECDRGSRTPIWDFCPGHGLTKLCS